MGCKYFSSFVQQRGMGQVLFELQENRQIPALAQQHTLTPIVYIGNSPVHEQRRLEMPVRRRYLACKICHVFGHAEQICGVLLSCIHSSPSSIMRMSSEIYSARVMFHMAYR